MVDEKYINQLDIDGETILDLTKDTITEDTLAMGETAHNAAGEPIVGKAKVCSVTLAVVDTPPVVDDHSVITFVIKE